MSRVSVLRDGLVLSLGTFTALPAPHPRTVDRARNGVAVSVAAVPGAVLGLICAGVGVGLAWLGVPALGAAVAALAAVQLSCRGFHLDGLGDTADGLASGYDREKALRIMRTGDAGPAAVATTVLVLLGQAAALAALVALAPLAAGAAVLVAVAWSRLWLVLPCLTWMPLARADGLGAGAGRSVRPGVAVVVVVLVVSAGAAMLAVAGWTWWAGPVVAVAGLLVGILMVWHVTRRLGGVTGDVMGAVVELGLTAMLLSLSALM